MSSLVHPRGPEPERTYWIRRGIVVLALVATLLVVGWIIRMLFGHGSASAGPVITPNASSLAGTPMVTPSVDSPSASGSPSSASSASQSASASSTPSPSPTQLQFCVSSTVGVGLTATPRTVATGGSTQLQVKLTNSGQTPCRVNFERTPLSLSVTSGIDHIWSTADCDAWEPRGSATTMQPGASWTFTETWTARRSASGCTLRPGQLRPGTYVATASLAGGQTSSQVLTLHD